MLRFSRQFARSRAGFTLAEILLAMLVFAIAITTILALLARSIETVDEIILKDEAMRLSGALEDTMQKLPFSSVYGLIQGNQANSGSPTFFIAFHYRAEPGNLNPRPSRDGKPGSDYLVLPSIKVQSDSDLSSYLAAREGRLFKVKMSLSASNPATQAPNPTTLPVSPDQYPSAVVVIYTEFFPVGGVNTPITGLSPVYAYNFAVRR